jgi:hypothetical protein
MHRDPVGQPQVLGGIEDLGEGIAPVGAELEDAEGSLVSLLDLLQDGVHVVEAVEAQQGLPERRAGLGDDVPVDRGLEIIAGERAAEGAQGHHQG